MSSMNWGAPGGPEALGSNDDRVQTFSERDQAAGLGFPKNRLGSEADLRENELDAVELPVDLACHSRCKPWTGLEPQRLNTL
jgi:hypothetical protein